jgi:hypothetical protein
VTVWLAGANWNCTISPLAAVIESGENVRVLFAFPTLTTWTVVAAARLLDCAISKRTLTMLTKGAADAQGRESESCELHIGGDMKDPDLENE